MPHRYVFFPGLICACLILSGCNLTKLRLPRVHKLTVQQGNVITQNMVDQLKPGMTFSQVSFIMGDPVFRNSFNSNRWDYIYTIELPGIFNDERRVSLYFDNERLAYFTGDYAPTEELPVIEADEAAEPEASTEQDAD